VSRVSLLAVTALLATPAIAAPALAPVWTDHAVIQRDQPIAIEGSAAPKEALTVTLGTAKQSVRADAGGQFRATFPALKASAAPLTLRVANAAGEGASASDLLVGDVWLCSGQSNMELPFDRALDSFNQRHRAADDGIRLLTIPKVTAPVPQPRFGEPVRWAAATSETVGDFSAACFYMGKQLRANRPGVPLGLINSNWGGSAARAWLTPEGGRTLYGDKALDLLKLYSSDPLTATQAFVPQWFDWWRTHDGGREPWTDTAMLDWKPVPKVSFWNEWKGSGLDTQPVANVWLRNKVTLTPEQAAQGGSLSIGAIDDLDLTFVNGHPVGYTFGWGVERTYRIPADYLHAGDNEILIAASNLWDTGGFFAGPDRLFFTPGSGGAAIPLGSGWQYSIGAVTGEPPRAPWDVNAGIGVMHNAMIAPFGPIRLAGVAWYQGESDVGHPDYDKKLHALFAGWRRQFGAQARMLVVQLANYGKLLSQPAASGWAELRQEQLEGVAADTNAALVSAIDIGEPSDIHPANKNMLGQRLAMAAEGKPMPMPQSARLAGDVVTVTFDGIEGGLTAYGGPYPLGVELCGDTQDSCRWALATLQGDAMRVATDGKPVTRVRHAWADAPVVNLHDGRGLPVPGFELAVVR